MTIAIWTYWAFLFVSSLVLSVGSIYLWRTANVEDLGFVGKHRWSFYVLAVGMIISFCIMCDRVHRELTSKNAVLDKSKLKTGHGMPSKCPEFYRSVTSADGSVKCVMDPNFQCTLNRADATDANKPFDYPASFDLAAKDMTPATICSMRSSMPWSSAANMDKACSINGRWQCINKDTHEYMLNDVLSRNPIGINLTQNQASEECNNRATDNMKGNYVAQLIT